MDYEFSDEQTMLLDSLRAFLKEKINPHEAQADRNGEVPVELADHIKKRAIEMGFYAANLPESVCGGGLIYATLGLMEHECFALTEPGAGSDIIAMKMSAVADGDDYVINGSKHFVSTPCIPDFAILFAVAGIDETERGKMTSVEAAMTKLLASEALGRVADNAVQIFGGMGLMEELQIERLWRDSRIERIWDGTSEIQRHIIARSQLRQYEN